MNIIKLEHNNHIYGNLRHKLQETIEQLRTLKRQYITIIITAQN